MTDHIGAARRQRTSNRCGERNGHYERDLITPVGKLEQLRVSRARLGEFLTEVFDRYQCMTGNVEEAVLEMYLQGVSTRKVSAITEALSGVKIHEDWLTSLTRCANGADAATRSRSVRDIESDRIDHSH